MRLEDLEVYSIAMELGKKCWEIVMRWNQFEKMTVGSQWVRAIDSVAANISEGWGRYGFKDSRNFLFIARGSLYEAKTWLVKSQQSNIISKEEYDETFTTYEKLAIKLNNYINIHNQQINKSKNNENQQIKTNYAQG
jgi:four helix bundle protein